MCSLLSRVTSFRIYLHVSLFCYMCSVKLPKRCTCENQLASILNFDLRNRSVHAMFSLLELPFPEIKTTCQKSSPAKCKLNSLIHVFLSHQITLTDREYGKKCLFCYLPKPPRANICKMAFIQYNMHHRRLNYVTEVT